MKILWVIFWLDARCLVGKFKCAKICQVVKGTKNSNNHSLDLVAHLASRTQVMCCFRPSMLYSCSINLAPRKFKFLNWFPSKLEFISLNYRKLMISSRFIDLRLHFYLGLRNGGIASAKRWKLDKTIIVNGRCCFVSLSFLKPPELF